LVPPEGESFVLSAALSFHFSSGRTVSHYGNLCTNVAENSVEHLKLFNRRQLFLPAAPGIQLWSVAVPEKL